MDIRIKLVDGMVYHLGGVEAERVFNQLHREEFEERGFLEFYFEDYKTRVYMQYIVSVEWKWVK